MALQRGTADTDPGPGPQNPGPVNLVGLPGNILEGGLLQRLPAAVEPPELRFPPDGPGGRLHPGLPGLPAGADRAVVAV
ncbi:MAG: hypothetical protein COS90_01610 [Deltaproteobacteria bacterium CG07_land_8_20_14_0_80_60_11]|nr:MAG: hypothetical protein COS90_01610 [Deltaproteobacteria bacterium CG07_land_8_20_14_0_80_60_11]